MLVFWKEKLVYLAVPKTGTTALEGALAPKASMVFRDPPVIKHAPHYRYSRFLAPMFEQAGETTFELMAVIRHPVSWLSSWYRYRGRDSLTGHANSTRDISFDDFVREYCQDAPKSFAAVGSQARFVGGEIGNPPVQHLFQYEDQDRLISFLTERIGAFPAPKTLNVSPVREAELTPEVLDLLKERRSEEFAMWDRASS